MMPPDYLEAAQLIAKKIAWRARCRADRRGRRAEGDDLQQQCLLYCLEIYRKGGWHDGLEGYCKICWSHCFRRIGLYVTRQAAPVTCGRDSEVKKQLPATIASRKSEIGPLESGQANGHEFGASDTAIETLGSRRGDNRLAEMYYKDLLSSPPSQERDIEISAVRAKIRARMTELGGDAPGTMEALAGWLDDVDPADAVERTGAPLAAVYGANKRFARAAREDMTLRSLALALALARDLDVADDSEYVGVA